MLQGNYYTSSLSRTLNPAPDLSSVHNHHSKRERIERIFAYLPCSQAYEYYAIYSKCEFFSFSVYAVHTLCYNPAVVIEWNNEKNELFKTMKGIDFEQIKAEIAAGRFIDPEINPARPDQQRIIVELTDTR